MHTRIKSEEARSIITVLHITGVEKGRRLQRALYRPERSPKRQSNSGLQDFWRSYTSELPMMLVKREVIYLPLLSHRRK